MSGAAAVEPAPPLVAQTQPRPVVLLLRRAWQQTRTKVGVVLVLLLVGVAVIGPFFAPHSPSEFVGPPYAHASSHALLGTDNLGRDVFSRFLWGGRSVLGLAIAATALGLVLGVAIGLVAAYASATTDDLLMRAMDVILAFPSLVLALVAVATVGPQLWLLVLVVGITTAPRVSRVTRGSSVEIVERDFVRACRQDRCSSSTTGRGCDAGTSAGVAGTAAASLI